MPCTGGGPPSHEEYRYARVLAALEELETGKPQPRSRWEDADGSGSWSVARAHLDLRTAELCDRLTAIEAAGTLGHYSLELQMWWRDHKAADRARLEREAADRHLAELRRLALEKLTAEERRALEVPRHVWTEDEPFGR